jgi:hypothetical protein
MSEKDAGLARLLREALRSPWAVAQEALAGILAPPPRAVPAPESPCAPAPRVGPHRRRAGSRAGDS